MINVVADEIGGMRVGGAEGEVGWRDALNEPQNMAGKLGIVVLGELSVRLFDEGESLFEDGFCVGVRDDDALGDAVIGEQGIDERSAHDKKELFIGLFSVGVVDVLLEFIEKEQITLTHAIGLVPRLDVSLSREDILKVVLVPYGTVLIGVVDDVVGIGQSLPRHGETEKVVGVGALVQIDDLMFTVVSHDLIITRLKRAVNAEKEVRIVKNKSEKFGLRANNAPKW